MTTDRRFRWAGPALLCLFLAVIRLAGLRIYPQLSIDEGLWNLQTKDVVRFADGGMNGLRQAFLSPLHFALTWVLFQFLPATLFSVRLLSAAAGLATLAVAWLILRARHGGRTAWMGAALIGLSFTLVVLNRRAFLESTVALLSVLAFYSSLLRPGWRRTLALALLTAALILYKSNAVYVLPCLLLPGEKARPFADAANRLLAVVAGIALAAVVYIAIYARYPAAFAGAWLFELEKAAPDAALLHIGRFGIYPHVLAQTFAQIGPRLPDLVLLSAASLIGLLAVRGARDAFGYRLGLWLAGGYGFLLLQSFQHSQYFMPLIVPAGLLAVHVVRNLEYRPAAMHGAVWALAALTLVGLFRVGWGVRQAIAANPPLRALQWIDLPQHTGGACLATAELAAATLRKCYDYHRIFHPYPPAVAPSLEEFVRDRHIAYVVVDDWETLPEFAADTSLLAELAKLRVARAESHWRGLIVDAVCPGCQ